MKKSIRPLSGFLLGLLCIAQFSVSGCREIPPTLGVDPENQGAEIGGVCFVAPPRPIGAEKFAPIKTINAGWVAIIPYAFSRPGKPDVTYNYQGQWWGESPEGAGKQIEYAKSHNLKIMLKPHVWVWGQGWPGEFTLDTEAKWEQWEQDYADYILFFAKMADSMEVEMLCIGTEYRKAVVERPDFWPELIGKVREVYSGKITYAANWDNYENVKFWDAVDYVGIDAYFPLSDAVTPEVPDLVEKWKPLASELKQFSKKWDKKILFTEYGWMSVDQAAWRNWELEANQATISPNMQAQTNAYEAFFLSTWDEEWFAGGFLWKWWEDHENIGGPDDKRYTPQNKPSAELISRWYLKSLP